MISKNGEGGIQRFLSQLQHIKQKFLCQLIHFLTTSLSYKEKAYELFNITCSHSGIHLEHNKRDEGNFSNQQVQGSDLTCEA
jgi:hypothetical protein